MKSLIKTALDHSLNLAASPFMTADRSGSISNYGDLWRTTLGLATFLRDRGVQPGNPIGCVFDNHWAVYPLILASAINRSSVIPISPELHRDELRGIVKDAGAKVVVREADEPADLPKKCRQISLEEVMRHAEAADTSQAEAEAEARSEPDDEPLLIVYSSGSTGRPKGIVLTERNLASNASGIADLYQVGPKDVTLCVMPCYHMNALMITGFVPFVAGAQVILAEKFLFNTAKFYMQKVEQYGVTVLSLTPPIMAVLMRLYRKPDDLASQGIRFAFCGAAPLESELWQSFEQHFNIPVYQGYGLTETTCWATMTPPTEPRRHTTVGVPVNCEIEIVRGDQSPEGEVRVRGPIMMRGYAGSTKTISSDEYFKTGDLGYIDEDGELVICGRIKDIIIRGGINILPQSIDRVLQEHPAVLDCATVGIPDSIQGEAVHSAVVPVDLDNVPPDVEIRNWLRQRLSPYNVPDRIRFVGVLPKTSTGKVIRKSLADILSGDVAREILGSVNTKKYVRYHVEPDGPVFRRIQTAVEFADPLRFVKYWGVGDRANMSEIDKQALDRLREFLDQIDAMHRPGTHLTLIQTVPHAIINGKDPAAYESYFREIADYAKRLGIDCESGAEIWSDGGLTVEAVKSEATATSFDAAWEEAPAKEELLQQAAKHSNRTAPEIAARVYYCANLKERPLIAQRYAETIFLTYNRDSQDSLLPDLPKIYIHSFKPKVSEKPWFADTEVNGA